MKLNYRAVTRFETTDASVIACINHHYGRPYDIVIGEEPGGDDSTGYIYLTVQNKKLNKSDRKKLDEFKETGEGYNLLGLFLRDMCNQELIEPGDYVVECCWG